ncbi:DsbA family protein [Brevundimonas goettingensis]|uniref:DsbA family protein n=1 Tax=Brevundimonas goettingensis TaxID=2774190 RepID=A0A975GV01_9CAUL|nr:DsbA family protein [Brevundimonas goettingensis]QTC90038.1 DsbA family protein [Brevundimonas goettingensis]
MTLAKKLTGSVVALLALALAACGGAGKPAEGDMALGAAEGAKVTVIEYASPTCPHCALWQKNTWPGFKARYVDTNKVRYIFRELPTPPQDVATAGILLARCAGPDKYFDVMHELLASQDEWRSGALSPNASLVKTAQAFGFSQEQYTACITNPDNIAALEKRIQAATADGVQGTPTFKVNGKDVITPGSDEGTHLVDLAKAIDAELAK